jgi:hypothetical protein
LYAATLVFAATGSVDVGDFNADASNHSIKPREACREVLVNVGDKGILQFHLVLFNFDFHKGSLSIAIT